MITEEQALNHFREHILPLVKEVDAIIVSKQTNMAVATMVLLTILSARLSELEPDLPILILFKDMLLHLQEKHIEHLVRESN